MAQNYVVMARKNLLKPSEAPKYYACLLYTSDAADE